MTKKINSKCYLTPTEAAEILEVSPSTMRRLADNEEAELKTKEEKV